MQNIFYNESIDKNIWNVVVNVRFVPVKIVENIPVPKRGDKAKNIISSFLSLDIVFLFIKIPKKREMFKVLDELKNYSVQRRILL